MAIGEINPGYMGTATVGGAKLRCTNFNVNPRQEPLFYDHTIGLRDSVPGSIFGGKGDTGARNPQKVIMRPGVKICQGNISHPLTEFSGSTLFDKARTGDDFDMDFVYICDGSGRGYSKCKVNSFTFSATAGDFARVTAEIMGISVGGGGGGTNTKEEKIVTWDAVTVSGAGDLPIQSVTLNVNNNCMPIYTAGGNTAFKLFPVKIRVGIQEVTGNISFYNEGVPLTFLDEVTPAQLSITAPGLGIEATVVYKPQEIAGSVSPVIATLPFVGVGQALG